MRTGYAHDALTQGAGGLNAAGAIALARSLDTSAPVGSFWLTRSVDPYTPIGKATHAWSQQIVWGNARNIVWGNAANVVWDNLCEASLATGSMDLALAR